MRTVKVAIELMTLGNPLLVRPSSCASPEVELSENSGLPVTIRSTSTQMSGALAASAR